MNPSNCSPMSVHEIFRSLLSNTASSNFLATSDQGPTASNSLATSDQGPTASNSLATSDQRPTTSSSSKPLTEAPAKYSIRFLDNDQNNCREKYDGRSWRLVCTWNGDECTNFVQASQLCQKHNAQRRNRVLPKKKKKPLISRSSLPIMNAYSHNSINDDDDIQIVEEYCKSPTSRYSMNSTVKTETPDFNIFSVEHLNTTDMMHTVKSEPRASSNYSSTSVNDIQYISSKTRANGLNIEESISKNIPPLTDFEEEYIGTRLMQTIPRNSLMLDAQLYLHKEAIEVVKKNYRLKMDNIAPEYFYDFLLRQPRLAIHYKNWFLRCKPMPPTTGCIIDTKVWTLGMIVRGAMTTDNMIYE